MPSHATEPEDHMNQDDRIIELESKVAELTALVERLTTPRVASAAVPAAADENVTVESRASRRHLLKLAGAATVGAAAAVATNALPAAATNGINIADPALPVRNDYTGNDPVAAFLFQAGSQFTNGAAAFDCALAGWSGTGGNNLPNGVYGFTLHAGFGVVGSGGGANSTGVLARGERANLRLSAEGTPAPLRPGTYVLGDVINDSTGNLWVCVAGGASPQWRKLAGPGTAGAFHALTPGRVYDSRAPQPAAGALSGGQNRTITVKDRRDANGAVDLADFVPAGATAVAANVTVQTQSGSGFLAINPGGNTSSASSTINWSAAGQLLANGVTLTLNANRELTIVCGGGGSTEFIIDISGYYL